MSNRIRSIVESVNVIAGTKGLPLDVALSALADDIEAGTKRFEVVVETANVEEAGDIVEPDTEDVVGEDSTEAPAEDAQEKPAEDSEEPTEAKEEPVVQKPKKKNK